MRHSMYSIPDRRGCFQNHPSCFSLTFYEGISSKSVSNAPADEPFVTWTLCAIRGKLESSVSLRTAASLGLLNCGFESVHCLIWSLSVIFLSEPGRKIASYFQIYTKLMLFFYFLTIPEIYVLLKASAMKHIPYLVPVT